MMRLTPISVQRRIAISHQLVQVRPRRTHFVHLSTTSFCCSRAEGWNGGDAASDFLQDELRLFFATHFSVSKLFVSRSLVLCKVVRVDYRMGGIAQWKYRKRSRNIHRIVSSHRSSTGAATCAKRDR